MARTPPPWSRRSCRKPRRARLRSRAVMMRRSTDAAPISMTRHGRRSTGRARRSPTSNAAFCVACRCAWTDLRCVCACNGLRPERWDYVDSPGAARKCADASRAAYTFCGHLHDQILYFETVKGRMSAFVPTVETPIPVRERRRWVAIVGSVGQPRDRKPAAAYTSFDTDRREMTFHRV